MCQDDKQIVGTEKHMYIHSHSRPQKGLGTSQSFKNCTRVFTSQFDAASEGGKIHGRLQVSNPDRHLGWARIMSFIGAQPGNITWILSWEFYVDPLSNKKELTRL
jgi:hypothetical protein